MKLVSDMSYICIAYFVLFYAQLAMYKNKYTENSNSDLATHKSIYAIYEIAFFMLHFVTFLVKPPLLPNVSDILFERLLLYII